MPIILCRDDHTDNHLEGHFTSQHDEREVIPLEEVNSTTSPDNSRQLVVQSHSNLSVGKGSSTKWNTPQTEQNPTNTGHFVYL